MAELVDEPLGPLRLLHYAFLVVLSYRSGELVVVHGGTVLSFAPEPRHSHGIFYLEDALLPVQPPDAAAVGLWRGEELLEELPEVNVRSRTTPRLAGGGGRVRALRRGASLALPCERLHVLVLIWKTYFCY